jgi:hypothetical protein
MKANSVEEELEYLAKLVEEAEALGIDPWPEKKPPRPWAKSALASFMIIMMLSWVSRWMYRFVEVWDCLHRRFQEVNQIGRGIVP